MPEDGCLTPRKLTQAKRRRLRREAVVKYHENHEKANDVGAKTYNREVLLRRRVLAADIRVVRIDELRPVWSPGASRIELACIGSPLPPPTVELRRSLPLYRISLVDPCPESAVGASHSYAPKASLCVVDTAQLRLRAEVALAESKRRRINGVDLDRSEQPASLEASTKNLRQCEPVVSEQERMPLPPRREMGCQDFLAVVKIVQKNIPHLVEPPAPLLMICDAAVPSVACDPSLHESLDSVMKDVRPNNVRNARRKKRTLGNTDLSSHMDIPTSLLVELRNVCERKDDLEAYEVLDKAKNWIFCKSKLTFEGAHRWMCDAFLHRSPCTATSLQGATTYEPTDRCVCTTCKRPMPVIPPSCKFARSKYMARPAMMYAHCSCVTKCCARCQLQAILEKRNSLQD